MVIAFLCNSPSWGGLEISNVKQAKWMKDRGHETLLMANPEYTIAREAEKAGIPLLPMQSKYKSSGIFEMGKLASQLIALKVDAVVIGGNKDIPKAMFLKWRGAAGIPFLYLQQMQIGVDKRDPWHTLFYAYLDAWISPIPELAAQVARKTWIRRDKIRTQYLGVEARPFLDPIPQPEARQITGLPPGVPLAGMVGRMDTLKGHGLFIEALALVRQQGIPLEGALIGVKPEDHGTAYFNGLLRQIDRLGLQEYIHFRPFSGQVAHAYYSLDYFVMANAVETYGYATIEALLCGLPVIGANGLGTKAILAEGTYGKVFPPRDARALAAQLRWCIDHPEASASLARKGKAYAMDTFQHTQFCEALEKTILSLQGKPGSGA